LLIYIVCLLLLLSSLSSLSSLSMFFAVVILFFFVFLLCCQIAVVLQYGTRASPSPSSPLPFFFLLFLLRYCRRPACCPAVILRYSTVQCRVVVSSRLVLLYVFFCFCHQPLYCCLTITITLPPGLGVVCLCSTTTPQTAVVAGLYSVFFLLLPRVCSCVVSSSLGASKIG